MEAKQTTTYFNSKGFFAAGFFNLTPKESFLETKNKAVIVDVREEDFTAFKCFDVPQVIYLPYSQIESRFAELSVHIPLIIADSAGLRSKEATMFLASKGFENIANMAGGMVEWERDGLPLVLDATERLDGSCMCQLKPRNKLKNK